MTLKAVVSFVWQLIGGVAYHYWLIWRGDKIFYNNFTIWLALQKQYLRHALSSQEKMQILTLKVTCLINVLRTVQLAALSFLPLSDEWRFLLVDQTLIMELSDASSNIIYVAYGIFPGGYCYVRAFFLRQLPGKGVTWLVLGFMNESVLDRDRLMRPDVDKLKRLVSKTIKFLMVLLFTWRKLDDFLMLEKTLNFFTQFYFRPTTWSGTCITLALTMPTT